MSDPVSSNPYQPQEYPTDPRMGVQPQYFPQAMPYWGGPPQQFRRPRSFDLARFAAAVVVVAGLIALIGSMFALYSVAVTPAAANVPDNEAPPGQILVGIGFYDVVPFAPPIVAEAIPMLMVLAALSAAPVLFGGSRRTGALAAVFAGTATLLSFVLAASNPLPSVALDGSMAEKLTEELGGQSVNELIKSVVSVEPGGGLIVVLIFALVGWIAAAVMVFRRPPAPMPPPLPQAW